MGAFLCCTRHRSHHDFVDAMKIYHERKILEMKERQKHHQYEYQQQSNLMESFQSLSLRSAQELPSEEFYSTFSGFLDADAYYYSQQSLSQSNSNEMSSFFSPSSFSNEHNDFFSTSSYQDYGLHENLLATTRRGRVFTI